MAWAKLPGRRIELVAKAQAGKLRPQDMSDGTFTISNLGMYNVDAFNAIINQPQAAILAVGRIAERVVPVNGQPAVQPMMVLTLSCDHRAVDGARGAQFLDTVATFIEEPLGLLGIVHSKRGDCITGWNVERWGEQKFSVVSGISRRTVQAVCSNTAVWCEGTQG